jgi:glycosyltransferase involved in cell wall biosynthesis
MNLAIVVSWLNQYGGAERVIESVHARYPDAPVFTTIHSPRALPMTWRDWDIRPSWLNRLPFINERHQLYLPFYPLGVGSLDLRGYETVLSITSGFAHGVRVDADARHVCYCLTPARFLWDTRTYLANENVGAILRALLPAALAPLRAWDRHAAEKVTDFVAISRIVQERIARCYNRESVIIYPPVNVTRFSVLPQPTRDYFFVQSRLIPYKHIDLAIEACNKLRLPLVIAGEGRDRPRLEKLAGPTVRFLGRVTDEETKTLMANCRAFIFPGEEDFGISPLEANAAGRPVIAFAGGGALDSISEDVNGELFHEPVVESLIEVLYKFDDRRFEPSVVRACAERFAESVFQSQLGDYLAGHSLASERQSTTAGHN